MPMPILMPVLSPPPPLWSEVVPVVVVSVAAAVPVDVAREALVPVAVA